jgi:hypothetical protein
MNESNEVKGLEDERADDSHPGIPHIGVFIPPGLGIHLLSQIGHVPSDDADKAGTREAIQNAKALFDKLHLDSENVSAVFVLVKTDSVREVLDEQTGEKVIGTDGHPVMAPGFELDGGLSGAPDVLTALLMHGTELVQRHAAIAAGKEIPVPEGKTEADRCPGCGDFHEPEDFAGAVEGNNTTH